MVTLRVHLLKNILEKSIGLLGSQNPRPLFLTTRYGIHTFFMRFPIDVVILDDTDTVVKIYEGLKPNRIFIWPPQYEKVIELPVEEIKKHNIKIGEKIQMKFI